MPKLRPLRSLRRRRAADGPRVVAIELADRLDRAHYGFDSLGLVGLPMRYAPDVGTAVATLVRHLHIHGRGGVMTLTVRGASAVLGYGIHLPQTVPSERICEGAVALLSTLRRCARTRAPR